MHLALLILPGPLLLGALLILRRSVQPVEERPGTTLHLGITDVQAAALAPRLRELRPSMDRLNRDITEISTLKRGQRTLDVTACDGVLQIVPLSREPDVAPDEDEPCAPRCAPVDHRAIHELPCWSEPPRGWSHLYVEPVRPGSSPPRTLQGPPTAQAARVIEGELANLDAQRVELDLILGKSTGLERDVLACTADAAGLRLLAVHVGAPARVPRLDPDAAVRQVPVTIVLRGRRTAMARWLNRLSHRIDIWTVTSGHVTPVPDEGPDIIELRAELLRYARPS